MSVLLGLCAIVLFNLTCFPQPPSPLPQKACAFCQAITGNKNLF